MVEADERPGADGPRAEEDGRDASCRERQAEHRRCKQSISPARALRSGGGSRDVPADETITPVQKSVNTSAEPPITASVPALKRRNETMGTKLVARNVETNV